MIIDNTSIRYVLIVTISLILELFFKFISVLIKWFKNDLTNYWKN